jgi:hypothetical protein
MSNIIQALINKKKKKRKKPNSGPPGREIRFGGRAKAPLPAHNIPTIVLRMKPFTCKLAISLQNEFWRGKMHTFNALEHIVDR